MADTYTVTRADGSTITREHRTHRVVSERTAPDPETGETKSVARILVKTSERGNIIESKPVETAEEFRVSTRVQKEQEAANIELEGTEFEARSVADVGAGTITTTPTVSRTKQLVEQRLNVRQTPDISYLQRKDYTAPKEFLETEEGKRSIQSYAYRLANPEKFEAGADTRLILASTKEKLTTAGIGVTGGLLVGGGLLLEPFTAGGSTVAVVAGTGALAKSAARTQETVFGASLTPEEKKLITSPAFVESFSSAIYQSQEKFKEENPFLFRREGREEGLPAINVFGTAKRAVSTLNVGISTSPEDFGGFLKTELEARGFSKKEIEMGVEVGQRRRTAGVVSDVIETVGAGVGAEKGVKLALKGSSSLATKVVATGSAGAIEAPLLTSSQARVTGVDVTTSELLISSALGGFTAGSVTGVIGKSGVAGKFVGGKTGKKFGEEIAEKGFYAVDPSEAIVDFTTTAAEKTTLKRGKKVVSFVPSFTESPTVLGTKGVKEFEGFGVGTVTGTATKTPTPKTKVFVGNQPISGTFDNTFTKPIQAVKEKPITDVKPVTETDTLTQSFVSSRTTPFVSSRTTPFVSTRTNPLVQSKVSSRVTVFEKGGFFTPPPRRGGDGFGFGVGTTPRREKDYVASLAAVGLGITGEASKVGELTGLGLRPVRKNKSKRKK